MSLLENDNKKPTMKLRINKDFAKKFEHKKKREHLENAKKKLGSSTFKKIFKEKNKEEKSISSSSSESEDENGEFVNEEVIHDFVKSLAKIREKKPEIYKPETKFFPDEYIKTQVSADKKDKKSPFFYKDMVREEALNEQTDMKPTKLKILSEETPVEEQIRLKKEFQKASKLENLGDNLFSIKTKSEREIDNENVLFDNFIKEEIKKNRPDEVEMLKHFWGDDTKLDETDKFLRRYIMTKGWVDEDMNEDFKDNVIDKEDEERDEEIDEYEEKFNFRFEEPDSNKIMTYGRDIPESMRKKNDARSDRRKEKIEKKKTEKKQIDEEIKQLKKIKKEEIFERIKKIQKIGGAKRISSGFENFLEKDFDPKVYDQEMNQNFDENYYDDEEKDEEDIKDYLQEIKKNEKEFLQQKDQKIIDESEQNEDKKENQDKENMLVPKTSLPIVLKNNLSKNEVKEIQENGKTLLWWFCDVCNKGIKELEPHFDCVECEDYTLCKKCVELQMHEHKMRKNLVPEGCIPPSDKEILQIISKFKICHYCKIKIISNEDYYFQKEEDSSIVCELCFQDLDMKSKRTYEKIEAEKDLNEIAQKAPHKLKDMVDDDELKRLVDEYYALDFEDIIAGGIKTKFKYTKVDSDDFGLSDELLLYTDDKLLNNYVSLKNIAPYANQQDVGKPRSLKKKKILLEKNAQENKKLLAKQIEKIDKVESKIKKMIPKTKFQLKKQIKLKKKADTLKSRSVKTLKRNEENQNKIEIETLEIGQNSNPSNNNNKITKERLKSYGMMKKI